MNGRALAPLLVLAVALAGCGLKGPLYLPEKSREVIIRPAPGAPAEAVTPTEAPPAAESTGEADAAPEAPVDRDAPPPGSAHG